MSDIIDLKIHVIFVQICCYKNLFIIITINFSFCSNLTYFMLNNSYLFHLIIFIQESYLFRKSSFNIVTK